MRGFLSFLNAYVSRSEADKDTSKGAMSQFLSTSSWATFYMLYKKKAVE